jgi:acyl-CoA synthetase (AMP-forming)/AMP-acid ligase II
MGPVSQQAGVRHPHDAVTVPQWLEALAAVYSQQPCVAAEDETLSFSALNDASSDIARGLLAHGIGKGSRVGILVGNSPTWVTWWAAVTRIGAVCVPLSTFLQPAELARITRHADLNWLVATRHFLSRDFAGIIGSAFTELGVATPPHLALAAAPYLRTIVLDDAQAGWARDTDWVLDAGCGDRWAELLVAAQREVHVDDEAMCIYTSGQGADPKGIVHNQHTLLAKAHYLREMFGFRPSTTTHATMPFFWVGGLVMALFPTMDAGGTTHCTERSTWGSGAVIGNTAAGSSEAAKHTRMFTNIPALGMTETFGIYSWGHELVVPDYPIAAPIDELQPGFELRVVDDEGNEAPDGTPGEILLRGPTLAVRLQKVARSKAFDDNGFYRTGDLGVRHGVRVSFLGRKDDVIKTSGANVSPAEVQRELAAFQEVAAAFVVGIDDIKRGQLVAAAVLLGPGATLDTDEMQRRLRERLSGYKVPKAIVILDSEDDIPMTPSMKVRKRELAALIRKRIDADR